MEVILRDPLQELGVRMAGAGGGNPDAAILALFANGEQGAWYDPPDLATLSQTWNGTLGNVLVGDPVGLMLDKSGNNHHMIQPTAGARPILRKSGDTYWLEGGSGRWMYSTDSVDFTLTSKASLFFAEKLVSSTGIAFSVRMGTTGSGYFDVRHRSGAEGDTTWVLSTPPGVLLSKGRTTPFTWINGVVFDVSQADLYSSTGGASAIASRYSGVPVIHSAVGGSWTPTSAMSSGVLGLFASPDGSFASDSLFYGMALVGKAVTESQAEVVEGALAGKVGAALSKAVYCAALGDSITAEYGGQDAVHSLIRYADGAPAAGGINLALPGRTIAQGQSVWNNVGDYSRLRLVTVQLGVNDTDPAESAIVAIARIQSLVDAINAKKPSGCVVYLCALTSNRQAQISARGPVDGEAANNKRLAMNVAIQGGGPTPITGADRIITSHVAATTDVSGNLAAAYDTGDGVHPNNAGRQIIADAIRAQMVTDGLLP